MTTPARSDVVKLFVGQIPKTLEEDGVREVFSEYGEIVEVVILRDRRSGMHQGCCFVKFNGTAAAQAAISALHNQRSLPPLRNPLQVRFADSGPNGGERGQTNAENKLFVGGVPSGCGEKELRTLFGTYGDVQDVYILASKYGSQEGQRGCAFVRYASPQSCEVAINSLHGKYAMKAGELPLVVRYADPPKNRSGGANSMYGGGGGRYGGWQGGPPLWPGGPSGPGGVSPGGWPMAPWNLGGLGSLPGAPGGMSGYPPWMMAQMGQPGAAYSFPPQQQEQGLPQQYQQHQQHQQRKLHHQHQPQAMSYGGMSATRQPVAETAMPPPPTPAGSAPLGSSGWSEHHTPDGLKYFYNTATGTSSWECPPELAGPAPAAAAPPVSLPLMGVSAAGVAGGAASLASSMASLSLAATPPTTSLPMVSMPMGGLPTADASNSFTSGFPTAGLALGTTTTAASPPAWGSTFP